MQQLWEREVRKMSEKQLCRHQGQQRRSGRRCSRHRSRDSPAAHGKDCGDTCFPHAAHQRPQCSRYPHCSPWRTSCRSRWRCPEVCCGLWSGVHTGEGFLAGHVAYGEPMLEKSIPEGLYSMTGTHVEAVFEGLQVHRKDPCWNSLWRTVSHRKDFTLEQFTKDWVPWEGPHAGAGEDSEEEGASETKCYELTATPIPHLSCTTWRGGCRGVRSEGEKQPKKNRGEEVEGRWFYFIFCFSLSYSIFNWQ